ncbi:MAG: (2Fe-2S) ferredoxin domain-containing protein [Clostridiales bacterium]|nr:(2Fe-2S) ferredoxin domain-containing protein [Clostridiales bacterium]
MMKTLKELEEIRQRTLESVNLRKDRTGTRVVVGMGTCGISAGARPVLLAFVEEIRKRNLQHVTVTQTGCVGVCRYEPLVEVYTPDNEKVTYVNMTPEKVKRVVTEHLVNGQIVRDFTIGVVEKKD